MEEPLGKRSLVLNIEDATTQNPYFRRIIFTNKLQLSLMTILPGKEIGEEIHEVDQFIRIESGSGKAYINDNVYDIKKDFAILIPAGSKHNIVNTDFIPLTLYTIYSSPVHPKGEIVLN